MPLTSPTKGVLDSPVLVKGLDMPQEHSELYDNFDIYHEMLDCSQGEEDDSALCDEGIKS